MSHEGGETKEIVAHYLGMLGHHGFLWYRHNCQDTLENAQWGKVLKNNSQMLDDRGFPY